MSDAYGADEVVMSCKINRLRIGIILELFSFLHLLSVILLVNKILNMFGGDF